MRSPAPPIIALLGLLGMLAGEAIVSYLRGHADVLASACHAKSFAIAHEETRTLASAARAALRQPEEVG